MRTQHGRGVGARGPLCTIAMALALGCGDGGAPPTDHAPTVDDATASTPEDTPVAVTITATDLDGDAITLDVAPPAHGTLTQSGLTVTYTPARDFAGTETLALTATAGGLSDTATLQIVVTPVNDPPDAVDDVLAAVEDQVQTVPMSALLANDTDVDGDVLVVSAVSGAMGGTVVIGDASIEFTPAADFTGDATFAYTISDGTDTDTATVTLQFGSANDPPVAVDDTATTAEDTALAITGASLTVNDSDPEGQALTVTAVSGATNGTVTLAGGTATFTPAANFAGAASFSYTVSDGAATDTGLVTITVTAVNDPPVAVDDARATAEDTALAITAASLTANDTDVDGGALTVTAVSGATNGTVTLAGGTATFTPTTGFSGTASFTYTVSDGAATDTGLVTITVTAAGAIAQLVGGNSHMCAVANDGAVKCWGLNAYGNLGLGDTNRRGDDPNEMGANLPEVDLGTGRTAVTLAAGGEHTCALLDNNTLKCWGYNSAGQLGLGSIGNRGDAPGEMGDNLPAVDLGTGRTALQVAAGGGHTCALLDNLTVKCWGRNDRGQLGIGDTSNRGDAPGEMGDNLPAVSLGTGLTVDSLVMGELHGCALFTNGTVKCWGFGSFGALGIGDGGDRGGGPGEMGNSLPLASLGTGRTALGLAAGHHTCALLDNFTVKCWGFGDFGQLGQGNTSWLGDGPGELGDNLPPVALGTGVTPSLIATMLYDSCVLTTNDPVKCWGGNLNGQLGQGDNIYRGDGPGEMGDNLPYIDVW